MAREFRFFKIGEANAEIARLEGELATAKAAASAASDNDSEIAVEATRLKAEVDSIKQQISEREATISALTKERDDARAEAAKAKTEAETHCKDFDANVENAASAKAQGIMATLGVPPQTNKPGATGTNDFSALVNAQVATGKSKTEAIAFCIKANPAAYAEWRKGDTSKL